MTRVLESVSAMLALHGGDPVRRGPWPRWPRADDGTRQNLDAVLASGRWAISGFYTGEPTWERRFAKAWAAFNGVPYCTPTTNGSSALAIALQALGVGAGDEVLVPGITWVASASAVAALNAVPVLVDVDADTLCMDAGAARAAITPRTRAILLVHLYCTVADLDAFGALSATTGVPLLEDCAQAHGARWRGRCVGAWGAVGTFSMQHGKVLTSGEGGAAITSSPDLYDRMERLRSDGRRFVASPPAPGEMELEEVGEVFGQNFCLSEFQAAVLADRLGHLEAENRYREARAAELSRLLADVGGVTPLRRHPAVDAQTFYGYCVRLDRHAFHGADAAAVAKALSAELDLRVTPIYAPLNRNRLYTPLVSGRFRGDRGVPAGLDPRRFALPQAERAYDEYVVFHHHALLGTSADMAAIAAAFSKVRSLSEALSPARA